MTLTLDEFSALTSLTKLSISLSGGGKTVKLADSLTGEELVRGLCHSCEPALNGNYLSIAGKTLHPFGRMGCI